MQAAGIPHTLSPAEQRYYMCELGLSSLQGVKFLAQMSGRADVSDDFSQTLSPETVVRQLESLLNPQDSDERRACFARRLVLIEAFLHHDLGDGKAARAAVTTGTAEDDAGFALPATPATTPIPTPALTSQDRAARARVLRPTGKYVVIESPPPLSTSGPMPCICQRIRPCTTAACRLMRASAAPPTR